MKSKLLGEEKEKEREREREREERSGRSALPDTTPTARMAAAAELAYITHTLVFFITKILCSYLFLSFISL
jgi:hypothetical protein